jgi:hypothetical protein
MTAFASCECVLRESLGCMKVFRCMDVFPA